MRILFYTFSLVVYAAMILIPGHRADAATVSIVLSNESEQFNETVQGFKKYLAQSGYSAEIKIFSIGRSGIKPNDIALLLNQTNATYLLALGSQAAQFISQQNLGIPVIAGLVYSPADIAGIANATGVYLDIDMDAQLLLIKQIFPGSRRIGVLYSAENEKKIAEASAISQKYGLIIEAQKAFVPGDIPNALESAGKRADVLWGVMDKVVLTPETAKQILLYSLRNKIPFIGPSENWAKAGATAAFGWNFADLGAQCGEIFLKLVKGSKVAEIAPVGPRKIEYSLNLYTADQMKIIFSPIVINRSKRVFKVQ